MPRSGDQTLTCSCSCPRSGHQEFAKNWRLGLARRFGVRAALPDSSVSLCSRTRGGLRPASGSGSRQSSFECVPFFGRRGGCLRSEKAAVGTAPSTLNVYATSGTSGTKRLSLISPGHVRIPLSAFMVSVFPLSLPIPPFSGFHFHRFSFPGPFFSRLTGVFVPLPVFIISVFPSPLTFVDPDHCVLNFRFRFVVSQPRVCAERA